MIDVIDLKKTYGDLEVLKGITVTIHEGEKVVIIGPSGSGKSTFLRCLNCMEDPTSGSIIFEGENLADMRVDINLHRRHIGMVFQQFNLFNNKTVLQNIMLAPVYIRNAARKKAARRAFFGHKSDAPTLTKAQIVAEEKQRAMDLLRRIGLEDKADVYPSTLSGGKSSASPSSVRWRCTRRSSCSTNRPPRSTPKWSAKCSTSSSSWPTTA